MSEDIDIWALVPAAGSGTRMQSAIPKQYLPLLGRPVILHTLERLCGYPRVRGVYVGIAADDSHWRALTLTHLPHFLGAYEGGATRARTVLNGLNALAGHARDHDWVMVHDAVRPCVRHADIDKLIGAAIAYVDGGLLAIPVTDTLKRADARGRTTETAPRANLWRALTPQMFRLDRLRGALVRALADGVEVTDESSAVEYAGGRPQLVEGHADNIKITLPADLVLAEIFLRQQAGGSA